jgi:hypothetical protein
MEYLLSPGNVSLVLLRCLHRIQLEPARFRGDSKFKAGVFRWGHPTKVKFMNCSITKVISLTTEQSYIHNLIIKLGIF